jgi:hypothetical protein
MSDGTASFDTPGRPLPSGRAASKPQPLESRVLALSGARERLRRRRRVAAILEWAALLGLSLAAGLMLLVAAVSLIAR